FVALSFCAEFRREVEELVVRLQGKGRNLDLTRSAADIEREFKMFRKIFGYRNRDSRTSLVVSFSFFVFHAFSLSILSPLLSPQIFEKMARDEEVKRHLPFFQNSHVTCHGW